MQYNILAKELAYNVLNTRKTELKTALGKAKGADIKRFADELKNHHDEIDKKLCTNGSASTDNTAGKCDESAKYSLKTAMGEKGAEKWPKISASRGAEYTVDSTEQISGEMAASNTWGEGRWLMRTTVRWDTNPRLNAPYSAVTMLKFLSRSTWAWIIPSNSLKYFSLR